MLYSVGGGVQRRWRAARGLPAPAPDVGELIELHRRFQGGKGSGLDVAAAHTGGAITFRLAGPGVPQIGSVRLPNSVGFAGIFAGRSASTPELVGHYRAWRRDRPREAAALVQRLTALAEAGCAALRQGDAAAWLEAFAAYGRGLQELGDEIGAAIVTAEHREIGAEAQRHGVAYKVSGAGGGDLGLACAADVGRLDAFRKSVGDRGFRVINVSLAEHGLVVAQRGAGVAAMSGDRRRIPEFYKLSVEERVRAVHERGLINTADFRALATGEHTLGSRLRRQDDRERRRRDGHAARARHELRRQRSTIHRADGRRGAFGRRGLGSACKLIRACGGFKAEATDPILIGQIQIVNLPDIEKAKQALRDRKQEIINLANSLHPNMVARGGGARDIELFVHPLPSSAKQMLVVHLLVDTRDAMGANLVNGMCEGVAPLVESITGGEVFLRILSNLTDRSLVRAQLQDSRRAARRQAATRACRRATASSSPPSSRPSIRTAPRRTTKAS